MYKLRLDAQAGKPAKQLIQGTCPFFYLLVQMLRFSQKILLWDSQNRDKTPRRH